MLTASREEATTATRLEADSVARTRRRLRERTAWWRPSVRLPVTSWAMTRPTTPTQVHTNQPTPSAMGCQMTSTTSQKVTALAAPAAGTMSRRVQGRWRVRRHHSQVMTAMATTAQAAPSQGWRIWTALRAPTTPPEACTSAVLPAVLPAVAVSAVAAPAPPISVTVHQHLGEARRLRGLETGQVGPGDRDPHRGQVHQIGNRQVHRH